MSKLYALTDGTYSDYHIEALTADKGKAKRLHDIYGFNVEEYEDGELDAYYVNMNGYLVYYSFDYGRERLSASVTAVQDKMINAVSKAKPFDDGYYVYVVAEDIEHARKIGKDLIMQYIAQEQGL